MTTSLDQFYKNSEIAQVLWRAQQEAQAGYQRAQRAFRMNSQPADKIVASQQAALRRALVEAAAVRLATAWEMFLNDLLAEYVNRRPSSFKKVWKLGAVPTLSDETVAVIATENGHPFQSTNKARKVLKQYLGSNLFGENAHSIPLRPVDQLMTVRHAIVHKGGQPTKSFHRELGTRKTAQGYLLSRPAPVPTIPATQFERLLSEVTGVCVRLHIRTFQRPRP